MNQQAAEAPFHILLVEDNPGDVYLLRLALQRAKVNFELTVLEDGEEALNFIREQRSPRGVDLAILDLNLPKNSGLEVLQTLRASSGFAEVPVVILSSSSSPRDLERIQESGAGRFITKPGDLEQFLNIGWTLKHLLAGSPSHG